VRPKASSPSSSANASSSDDGNRPRAQNIGQSPGWHIARDLAWPDTITPLHLPPYSPELNPIERVWLYLRERFLSHRLFNTFDAIMDACCNAWNALLAENGRIASLGGHA
jgi:hypothetical protein